MSPKHHITHNYAQTGAVTHSKNTILLVITLTALVVLIWIICHIMSAS